MTRSGYGRVALVVGAAATWLTVVSCGHGVEGKANAGPAGPAPEVTVATPLTQKVGDVSEHTGRAEAVETVEVRARATGYLQRIPFREGAIVKKGDLLFVVDPRPYDAAVERAKAELERARVDEELAARDAKRAEQLFRSNSIPEREWDTQSMSLKGFAARTHIAQAALSSAQLDADYAYVRAPIAGRIGRIQVTQGNLVGPQAPTSLTTLVSLDPLYVYVDVDEARALRLVRSEGGAPPVARVAFADEADFPHEAKVDFVDNQVDPQTGTLRVRAVVKNPDGRLTPGLFARVRLPEGAEKDTLLVADRAIGTDQDRRFVLVVDDAGKVNYKPVKLGPLHDGLRVVREGITGADKVIVRGLQRVRPGAVVKATAVEMSKDLDQAHAAADGQGQGSAK